MMLLSCQCNCIIPTPSSPSFLRMLKCTLNNLITGEPCGQTFRRSWNLKRHMQTQHNMTVTTFVQCEAEGDQNFNYHGTPTSQPKAEDKLINALTKFFDQRSLVTIEPNPHKLQRRAIHDHASSVSRSSTSIDLEENHEIFETDDSATTELPSSEDDMSVNLAKRKRGFNRVAFAKEAPSMPIHDIRMSGQIVGQMKAIDWLKVKTKSTFDQEHKQRLVSWGFNSNHQGICI